MASLEQSIELYKLMRDRCMASSLCKNQAQVYSEMVDFISSCDSVEDSMRKIKNSKYYLAPSVALMKDKLEAWKKAANENEMSELVDVYNKKIDEINNDDQEIYASGYEQSAFKIKSDYINTMQAFSNIFVSYISYLCSEEEKDKNDILNQAHNLIKPSTNFEELSKIQRFRNLVSLDDASYKKFVSDISSILSGESIETFNDGNDIDADLQEISDYKDQIIEVGKDSSWNVDYEKVKVTSPSFEGKAEVSNLKYKYEGLV